MVEKAVTKIKNEIDIVEFFKQFREIKAGIAELLPNKNLSAARIIQLYSDEEHEGL